MKPCRHDKQLTAIREFCGQRLIKLNERLPEIAKEKGTESTQYCNAEGRRDAYFLVLCQLAAQERHALLPTP